MLCLNICWRFGQELKKKGAELSTGREETTESHLMMEAKLTAVVSVCVFQSHL